MFFFSPHIFEVIIFPCSLVCCQIANLALLKSSTSIMPALFLFYFISQYSRAGSKPMARLWAKPLLGLKRGLLKLKYIQPRTSGKHLRWNHAQQNVPVYVDLHKNPAVTTTHDSNSSRPPRYPSSITKPRNHPPTKISIPSTGTGPWSASSPTSQHTLLVPRRLLHADRQPPMRLSYPPTSSHPTPITLPMTLSIQSATPLILQLVSTPCAAACA